MSTHDPGLPTVYQTQWSPNIDPREALRYGELSCLVEQPGLEFAPSRLVDELRRGLRDFTGQDYLLPVGSPIVIGAVFGVLARAGHSHLNVLRWDRKTKDYHVVTLEL